MFAMGPAFFSAGTGTLALTGTFASAFIGTPYSSSLAITGGSAPYSLTAGTGVSSGSLPAGLSLSISGSNLVLSGTPTGTAGTSSFTASIGSTDGQTATSAQSIVVSAAGKWYDALFASGEHGMVVDFNDLSTLFQDTAHTVPVITVGDPIKSAKCKRTGAYGVVNYGSATLAYDATYSKYYAAGDAAFNLAFAGAVPASLGGNATVSMIAVCSYASTSATIGSYIGPAYPTNPSNGNCICLAQILDGSWSLEYFQAGSGRGKQSTALSGVKVATGVKDFTSGAYHMTVYDGVAAPAGTGAVAGGNITAMNFDIGRGGGTAQRYYCLVAIDRTLAYTEIQAYNVAGQAL